MKPFKIILPIAVLAICLGIARKLIMSPPEARRWGAPAAQLNVEARKLAKTGYSTKVTSQGVVRARTESTLIPEISGKIVDVSEDFRNGGFFEQGELLVKIDPSDYETALVVAKAAVTQAEATLEQERAQAEQARENWKSLGDGSKPSPLALREPQLAQAQANLNSAMARVAEAERNLARTEVRAPYAGRILEKRVDIGQFVSTGTIMASIYAIDYAEIRLPLSDDQLGYVDVPERYRGDAAEDIAEGPAVTLKGKVGRKEVTWSGQVVRTEGSFDASSRQLFVIAQVDDPYGRTTSGQPPLKVGQFVTAEIDGSRLEDVFVIPRSALRSGDEVLIINDENKLFRRSVEVVWGDEQNVVADGKLKEGELLCLTQVPFAVDGAICVPDIEGEGKRLTEAQKQAGGWGGKGKGKGGKGGKGGAPGKKGAPPGINSSGDKSGTAKKGGKQ